ncbi:ATP-grasp domain-containing protein [Pseudoalteromonas sp. TB64]|uniref:ATP-grasp domain-containing protein n=1 Tax=Pseudoalteromonas sp. TB64 TaxID=1938600 RepID=UPI00040C5A1F|nr:ATP-grasp domain-containing protein [Pseudoalteromonas sp. TB64]
MANFLITGARAPAALELARNLFRDGHIIYMADSLAFPLAKHSKCVKKTFRITAPKASLLRFKNDIKSILKQYNIDVVIPTCEEVFYISAVKPDLEPHSTIFCPDFNLIKKLHSKHAIYCAAKNTGFSNPNTKILSGAALLAKKIYKEQVIKKEFCRFGTGVLIEPNFCDVLTLVDKQLEQQFIIQNKVKGIEYSSYAIANNGVVLFDSIYTSKHKVKMGAGIYFTPVINKKISVAIKAFCKKNNITGQISFDVIENAQNIYLLECNPRATSGLHLLSTSSLSSAFLGQRHTPTCENEFKTPKMITLAMLLIGLPIALKNAQFKQWKSDYQAATDVISVKNDRSFILFSLLSLFEIITISIKTLTSLRAASTFDIEWDGEDFDDQ